MRKVKNITVCVTPEIYREARMLAAEYDATVSAFVAFLLPRLRIALERQRFRKGGPKTPAPPAPAPDVPATPPTPSGSQEQALDHCSLTPGGESAKTGCETVPAT